MTVASVRLPDGRALAFQEFGDPSGFPILNCHGGLLCRLDIEPAAATAAELGLRIVSPDRPGIGPSDRRPGASTGYRAFVAPWGFAPEDVAPPVTLWQGDRDRLVPAAWATMLAARLPDARVVTCPGEDHFTGLTRRPELLRTLAATAP